jgi:glycosyltransferase involved in cell wall biosynthesis
VKIISVIIPVYQNEGSLEPLYERIVNLENLLAEKELGLELIFINDGSTDNSLQKLLNIKQKRPQTKIISLTRNFGAVETSRAGFSYVTGDAFTTLAADLQDPPSQILTMVDHWLKGNKLIISARQKRYDPLLTKLFAWVAYKLIRFFALKNYPKTGYNMMLMDKTLLPYMKESNKGTYPTIYATWLGFKPKVLFYDREKRIHGSSMWTFAKKINLFLTIIFSFSTRPLRLFSFFGLLTAATSFLYLGWIVAQTLLGNINGPRGYPTVICLIIFFSGCILSMLGMLGEYIVLILESVNKRPETVIDEEYL